LDVYVFDDLDPEPTNYIGKASVPLITLSQDKPLAGRFQLTNVRNNVCLSVCVVKKSFGA